MGLSGGETRQNGRTPASATAERNPRRTVAVRIGEEGADVPGLTTAYLDQCPPLLRRVAETHPDGGG